MVTHDCPESVEPDDIPIPDNLPDDAAEAYRMGFRRGESAGRKAGYDCHWRGRP